MPQPSYDYLILGQGLAGSLLAWHLIHAGQRVLVMDDGHRSSSSKVAAGLINPLAGMRFNCAPGTDDWLTSAHAFYSELGALYGRTYFRAIDMQRLFRSPEQERFYQRQAEKPDLSDYLGDRLQSEQFDNGIRAPHGGFEQHQTGYLSMPHILIDLRDWLQQQSAYIENAFDYADIEATESQVSLGEINAEKLVFCEGYRMRENPWFQQLPLQPDKGEFLRLQSKRKLCEHIVNGAHMLIPLGDGSYRFGATHQHSRIDGAPTPEAREQLEAGMSKLLENTDGIRVIEQTAGVRPATSDRQPFVGPHPRQPRLHIFNGFGARGALSIPWHAKQFAAHLMTDSPIPAEASIERYRDKL